MKRFVLIAIMTLAASGVFASGADFYKECAGCHGAKGKKAVIGASKVINAMSKDDITKALKDYKNDTHSGAKKAMMKGQVTKLSDAQIYEEDAPINFKIQFLIDEFKAFALRISKDFLKVEKPKDNSLYKNIKNHPSVISEFSSSSVMFSRSWLLEITNFYTDIFTTTPVLCTV